MEKTVILNKKECGYSYFVIVGDAIIACGLSAGAQKLDIMRVMVVADESKRKHSGFGIFGHGADEMLYDVDVDIYLADGSKIEVHSSERKFLKKLLPYVWELHKNRRVEFYGDTTLKGGKRGGCH